MASKYSLVDFDSEEEREKDPLGPPMENLFAAADYLRQLLSANHIVYAFMGGFAMICRGSKRTTRDIDVATKASMRVLWQVIEPQPRLIIPDTKLLDGVVRIFVRTGSQPNGDSCPTSANVEVDLIIPGAKGTPLSLENHIRMLTVDLQGRAVQYPGLDVLYMMRTKLRACTSRTLDRDVADIRFLLDNFPAEVAAIADQLEAGDKDFFLNIPSIRSLTGGMAARYRQILGR